MLSPDEDTNQAVRASVAEDGQLVLRVDAAKLPSADHVFVADHCQLVCSGEVLALQFTQCEDPVQLVPVNLLSVRMRKTQAIGLRGTFNEHFRTALAAGGGADCRDLAAPRERPGFDCILADYAMCRTSDEAASVIFYKFEVRPGSEAVGVHPLVQVETTAGVLRRLVSEIDTLLGEKLA